MSKRFVVSGLILSLACLATSSAVAQETDQAKEAGEKDAKPSYTDEKYDFSITVPEPWEEAPLQGFTVPGVARAAFAGENKSSIVLFVQEPGQAYEPRVLVDLSAKSMKNALKAKIIKQDVREVAGKKAMWLIVEAPGTGGALTGEGSVATTQHWVAIPREKDLVIALLTTPASDFESNEETFAKALQSLKVGGKQTEEQQASK